VHNAIENCKAALLRHDPLTAYHNQR
jgi:hypothetical protein